MTLVVAAKRLAGVSDTTGRWFVAPPSGHGAAPVQDFDDTLWLRRAHSVGNRRQLLNMITYALGVNALSMHVRRQGLAPPRAA